MLLSRTFLVFDVLLWVAALLQFDWSLGKYLARAGGLWCDFLMVFQISRVRLMFCLPITAELLTHGSGRRIRCTVCAVLGPARMVCCVFRRVGFGRMVAADPCGPNPGAFEERGSP
jgi:hypothetical protein